MTYHRPAHYEVQLTIIFEFDALRDMLRDCVFLDVSSCVLTATITACVVAQCGAEDDVSSEGETLKFDCVPGPNPVTDHNQT